MKTNQDKKNIDCIKMKREIQERLYEETRNMTSREFREHIHRRISQSRFAAFLDLPVTSDSTAQ